MPLTANDNETLDHLLSVVDDSVNLGGVGRFVKCSAATVAAKQCAGMAHVPGGGAAVEANMHYAALRTRAGVTAASAHSGVMA